MLDVPVPEVCLQSSRIVPLAGERGAAGVAKHVRVGLEAQTRLNASTLNHAGEASGTKGRSTLRSEDEGRLGLLFALKAPHGSQFIADDRVSARCTPLHPANMQRPRGEIDLISAEVNKLDGPKAVSIGH